MVYRKEMHSNPTNYVTLLNQHSASKQTIQKKGQEVYLNTVKVVSCIL